MATRRLREQRHLYTVGHSNITFDRFLAALEAHAIGLVVDVRSRPSSRYVPWAGRQAVAAALARAGIAYAYAGRALGGKPEQVGLLTPAGTPDYDKIAVTPAYQRAIEALERVGRLRPVAILCSEADPSKCHRERLIGRTLRARGWAVRHILPNGRLLDGHQTALF